VNLLLLVNLELMMRQIITLGGQGGRLSSLTGSEDIAGAS
jgi:hypothetical protein